MLRVYLENRNIVNKAKDQKLNKPVETEKMKKIKHRIQ